MQFSLITRLFYLRPLSPVISSSPSRRCCLFNPSTAVQFSAAFKHAAETHSGSPWFNTEELTSLFHSTCQNILDTVAPYKILPSKPQSELWLNDTTRAVRRECRRVEHKRKKDKLQVSFDILMDSWWRYQKIVNYFKQLVQNLCSFQYY